MLLSWHLQSSTGCIKSGKLPFVSKKKRSGKLHGRVHGRDQPPVIHCLGSAQQWIGVVPTRCPSRRQPENTGASKAPGVRRGGARTTRPGLALEQEGEATDRAAEQRSRQVNVAPASQSTHLPPSCSRCLFYYRTRLTTDPDRTPARSPPFPSCPPSPCPVPTPQLRSHGLPLVIVNCSYLALAAGTETCGVFYSTTVY